MTTRTAFAAQASPAHPRGLTLFEVVIALAVFVMSMAAIGQLVANGVRGSVQSRLETQAVLRCESTLAELVAGVTPIQAADSVPYPDDPAWTWSVAVSLGPQEDLYLVEVTAAHPSTSVVGNVSFTLERLIRDPQVALEALAEGQQAPTTTGGTGGTSGGAAAGSSQGGR